MKFEEPEIIELGLAADLTQIEYGKQMETPPSPVPTFDPGSVYIPETE